MTDQSTAVQPVWIKAAVLGSTWASIEIVVGSFLHNIRFPLSGTILATLGSVLLIAGSRLWNDRGLFWRAGLICALMKSISPSAVIFGPMVGIVGESLLLQVSVTLLGRNPAGYLLGSALASMMPVVQKTAGLLIAFGPDAGRLYVAMYEFAARSLRVQAFGPLDLLVVLVAINLLLGVGAGVLGMVAGKKILHVPQLPRQGAAGQSPLFTNIDPTQRFTIAFLFLHVAAMAGGFAAILWLPLWASASIVACYLLMCVWLYPRVRRQFRRPRLWIEFGVIALLAGLFLGSLDGGSRPWSGVSSGAEMTVRAALVIAAFTAISTELRNPVIVTFLLRRGLGQLSASLEVAFQALPSLVEALGREKLFLRHPVTTTARLLSHGARWLEDYQHSGAAHAPVFIVTGEQGSGKTSFTASVVELLRRENWNVGGILAQVVYRDGAREGYDIVNLLNSQQAPFCRTHGEPTGIVAGRFHVLPDGVSFGNAALALAALEACDCICVDEIGPLELNGNGWATATDAIVRNFRKPLVIVVRSLLVESVLRRWDIHPRQVWHAGKTDTREACNSLLQARS